MSRSLFEEAIADAKQLRDVAEQNAKRAIVEAVTPKIKEFIERQLTGDSDEMDDNDNFLMTSLSEDDNEDVLVSPSKAKKEPQEEDDSVELSESALQSLITLVSSKKTQERDPLSEAFSKLTHEEQQKIVKIAKGEYLLEAEEKINTKMSKETSGVSKMAKNKHDMYEFDLDDLDALDEDKIVIDFGKDIELDKENPYTVLVTTSDEEEEEVTLEEPPEGEEEEEDMGDEVEVPEAMPDEEEAPTQEMSNVYEIDENLLRRELMRLREAKASKGAKKTKESNLKNMPGPKAAAGAFGGGKLKDMDEIVMNRLSHLKESYNQEVRKNRDLQQQLNEYRNGIETLREQLSELNLFNAKLLFVNKLTQEREVSSTQRRTVVEALDGAKSLREAKLIYKGLADSLDKSNSASLNESARRLSPGQASRPMTSGGATQLNESTHLDRWATLAGIKQ